MEPSDENITLLLGMGFDDIGKVRRALKLAKNDLNEAVSILTGEGSQDFCNDPDPAGDIEMKDSQYRPGVGDRLPSIGTGEVTQDKQLPSSYNEAVSSTDDDMDANSENVEVPLESIPEEFPVTNLYELEDRIFTENWSIPYRKNESLGKCLLGATKVVLKGEPEKDPNCKRFMERALPECFQKLLMSDAVRRWNTDILDGVYNMMRLFVDLAAARLQSEPIPIVLLSVLTQAFDPDCEFHFKNRNKRWDRSYYEDLFGFQKCPAISPSFCIGKDPYGWLVNLINRFAYKGGLNAICDRVEKTENINAPILATLLQPLGVCASYLNPDVTGYRLGSAADKAVMYVKDLKESDIKEKEIGKVFDLLRTLKLLCQVLWKDKLSCLDELHLGTLLNMLKSTHYNARMNALKEICKLIKEAEKSHLNKTGISSANLMQWLLENKILSIAFQSSLHQHQYCEKLKKVVEFIGPKLSNDELSIVWTMQTGKHNTVVDNVHSIIASAAQSFTSSQLEHLIVLLQQSWNSKDEKSQEKLLWLIGSIGREISDSKAVSKLLQVVWEFSHVGSLPTPLIDQAVQSHLDILTQSQHVTDQIRNSYIEKCIQDIRDGVWVVPAIRHLQSNLEAMLKQPHSKSHKSMLQDLQKQTDVIKLVTISLNRAHQLAVKNSPGHLDGGTLIENQYKYGETVVCHLRFVQYLLQDGELYLSFMRVKDIWDCLMLNEKNCEEDYETAFEWFTDGIPDLENETKSSLFTSRMLKVDVPKISQKGFKCFRIYFESVNAHESKIKLAGHNILVEKQDLVGLSYLWQIVLETPYEDIAVDAAQYLMQLCYTFLSPKLKKSDPASVHKRFIAECYERLESFLARLGMSEKPVADFKPPQKHRKSGMNVASRDQLLLGIKRLLFLASSYITTVEENYVMSRRFPAHGSCFHGFPITIHVNHESAKTEFEVQTHSNESLSSLRRKVAKNLGTSPECLVMTFAEKVLTNNKDQKLLHQLGIENHRTIFVKLITSNGASASVASSLNDDEGLKPSSLLEREKGLPSYLMAIEYKVFEKLYELAQLEQNGITDTLRELLLLLPTDGSVLNAFDVFILQDTSTTTANMEKDSTNFTRVFEEYFKLRTPKMSPLKLLYNLQVLSSKLMPTEAKEDQSSFRENFLDAGGLSLVLSILQPDAIPPNTAYDLRQSCYFVCLQLTRSLLCGETSQPINLSFASPSKASGASSGVTATLVAPDVPMPASMATSTPIKLPGSPHKSQSASVASSWPGARSASPVASSLMSSSPGSSAGVTPDNATEAKRARSGSLLDSVAHSARMVVEMMNRDDYAETIACLLRVAWAAAAGQLQLNTHRHNRSDDADKPTSLKSGICILRNEISAMDASLSENAVELLVMCLQLRANLMNVFYYLPYVNEFIVDILVGCPSQQVRETAVEQLTILSKTEIHDPKVEKPRDYLLRTLLQSRLPLWNPSSYLRAANHRIQSQSTQYFELLCNLLRGLSKIYQEDLKVYPSKLLEDEIQWLSSSGADPGLLLGHLKLIQTLFTCEGVDKRALGKEYIKTLLDDFLFSASKFVQQSQTVASNVMLQSGVSCTSKECRIAAFAIFVTLAEDCAENLCDIVTQLISRHHSQLSTSKEWEFQPPVAARALLGFVGLQNGGATCYMNSVIQQLYMQPGIREALLKVDESKTKEADGIFYQFQSIFGHLLEGKMQYYRPEAFWKSFKLWGRPVNVREQQDAFEFFTSITNQLDEKLKEFGHEEIFKKTFCGVFADQKICKDCPHRYEREEEFYSIPVTVKCRTLESSLEQFVNDEIMEGENAYYCEKCRESRTTVKRLRIKSLPQILVIQLKRFWYDWEAGRAIKFDDSFQFPWILDVQPYMSQGIVKDDTKSLSGSDKDLAEKESSDDQYFYELVGIIVHSGQANAGHYYSFIKNRRTSTGHVNRWYRFNDTTVEEFEMTDANLEAECFGGSYKVARQDKNSQYPENRIRNWNAYMLFYEAIDKNVVNNLPRARSRELLREEIQELRCSVPSSPTSSTSSGPPSPSRADSLSQLSALVKRGEKRGIFSDNIPPSIRRLVLEENLQFMQNRDVYNEDYFRLVYNLCSCNIESIKDFHNEAEKNIALCSFQLAVHFLFNTYFRTTKNLRTDFQLWVRTMDTLLHLSPDSRLWFLNLLAGDRAKEYLGPYLVECPNGDIRSGFCNILISTLECFITSTDREAESLIDKVIGQLLDLIETNVINCTRQSNQYFEFFHRFANLDLSALKSLYSKGVFRKFLNFLVGPSCQSRDQRYVRRWSSAQAQDFRHLHLILIALIIQSDTRHRVTIDASSSQLQMLNLPRRYKELVEMPSEIEEIIYSDEGERYISECLNGCIEIPSLTKPMGEMIMHCCWCNEHITKRFIRQSQILLESVQPNDLKNVLQIISDVLCMEDPLQSYRVNLVVDGCKEENIKGILSIVKNSHISDPRRSYQCIKILVTLSQKCSLVKAYLLQNPSRWQWAVDWLKKKMNEYYWIAQPHVSNESHVNKSFQRTVSAQYTLAEATALLTEIEKYESKQLQSGKPPISTGTQSKFVEEPEEDWEKEVADDA